jgi:hypothetical protein
MSPSRHVPYARLAAEECSYHLTQDDSGQMAAASLAKNDLHYFNQPVRFIFGKSYVQSSPTGDLFEGVNGDSIPYHAPPGFAPHEPSAPQLELGGSWFFYRQFWQAHGLGHLADLLQPEIMAQFSSRFTIPLIVENPTDQSIDVNLSINLPAGWTFVREPDRSFSVPAHGSYSYIFETKTPAAQSGWQTLAIAAESNHQRLGQIRIRTQLSSAAMPE